jgi:hypothetical membrane protein
LKVDESSLSTTPKKDARTVRFFAVCGIIATVFSTVMVAIESLSLPDHSQISDYISDLGVGQYAILQDINFWIFGILVFLFCSRLWTLSSI